MRPPFNLLREHSASEKPIDLPRSIFTTFDHDPGRFVLQDNAITRLLQLLPTPPAGEDKLLLEIPLEELVPSESLLQLFEFPWPNGHLFSSQAQRGSLVHREQ